MNDPHEYDGAAAANAQHAADRAYGEAQSLREYVAQLEGMLKADSDRISELTHKLDALTQITDNNAAVLKEIVDFINSLDPMPPKNPYGSLDLPTKPE